MYPFNRHNRLREDLSAYIDGRLSAREAAAVESHLASCGTCPAELEGLRLASQALRGLPAVEAPRSFALTPEMAGMPSRKRVTSYPALNAGMRLSAAGLAVALAAVMFVDFGGSGGTQDEAATRMEAAVNSDAGGDTGLTDSNYSRAGEADDAAGGAPLPAATGVPWEAFSGGVGADQSAATGAAPLAEAPAETKAADELTTQDDTVGGEGRDVTSVERLGLAQEDADGISTTAVVEIVLAALLGSAIGAAVLVTVAERRRLR